jgi:ABC-2 type transport system ATP-binding protein
MGLKGINMMVNKGDVYGLLGLNGSGKSTTLKVISNQICKDFGAVFFEGK